MASFLVKLDMDRPKKRRRKKKLLRVPFLATQAGAFPKKFKKSSKKIQKIKNVILASFLAKWGYDRLKRRKKKSFWVPFLPTSAGAFPKKKN